jgi:cation-transporting ATPase 13A1
VAVTPTDAALAAGWKAVEDSTFASQKEGPQQESVTVLHRFPFTSALKRMAVVVRAQQGGSGSTVWVVAKGAPEVIEQHLASRPASYDAGYKRYAAEGAR